MRLKFYFWQNTFISRVIIIKYLFYLNLKSVYTIDIRFTISKYIQFCNYSGRHKLYVHVQILSKINQL